MAVLGAIGSAAIMIFGTVSMLRGDGDPGWFLVLWVVFGLGIIGFNLWSAFAPNGHVQTITTHDGEPPTRRGMRIERQ